MDPSLTLEMAIKDGKAIVGLESVAKAEEKVEKGAGKIAREAKQADAALTRFAEATRKIDASPLERYQTLMLRLDKAWEKGKLSSDEYTRAAGRMHREFRTAQQD